MTRLGVEGITYLQARNLQGVHAETEVNVSLSIANLTLYSWTVYPEPFHQLFSEQISEVSPRRSLGNRADIDHHHIQKLVRQLSINTWNVLLLAALTHISPGPGAHLIKDFPAFVTTYREALAASSSAINGVVLAAANINHCYASVKLWLLLERMLSQTPETPDGRDPIPKTMPFVIWNELWPPFSDLITAYEADVSKGQDTVRVTSHTPQFGLRDQRAQTLWSATSSVIADLFQFLKDFHSVLALETAVHEATLNRLRMFGQPEGSNNKVKFFRALFVGCSCS